MSGINDLALESRVGNDGTLNPRKVLDNGGTLNAREKPRDGDGPRNAGNDGASDGARDDARPVILVKMHQINFYIDY